MRDYGTALWDGGDAACDHALPSVPHTGLAVAAERSDGNARSFSGTRAAREAQYPRDTCGKCGAVRVDRQIGLEATPDEYLATMVSVFREVRRVLRRDGVCFVNMGDSYSSGARTTQCDDGKARGVTPLRAPAGIAKPKDLLLMPARLALALQADGWWVRSDIIWHKPNPMPESCTDRPTSAHEHVFLLTKSGTPTGWTHRDGLPGHTTQPPPDYRWVHKNTGLEMTVMPADWDTHEHVRKIWRRVNLWRAHDYFYDADAVREEAEYGYREHTGEMRSVAQDGRRHTTGTTKGGDPSAGRNLRNVWTIATHAYSQCHFATFPPELAERCIKAGTSERGACSACGKPWVRVVEKSGGTTGQSWHNHSDDGARGQRGGDNGHNAAAAGWKDYSVTTTGWSPGCQCRNPNPTRFATPEAIVPCTVLDPFAGAGTTLLVADRLQRDAIGIELNTAYTEMAMERCRQDAPLFTSFPPAEPPEDERMADLFTDMAAD